MELPILPQVSIQKEQPPPPAPEARLPAPTADQVERADEVFASDEAELAAGMLGVQCSALLLRDLAREHLRRDEEDAEEPSEEEEPGPGEKLVEPPDREG